MKIVYVILLISVLLIGVAIAGVNWDSNMDLDKTHTDAIKRATGVSNINPDVSDVFCDNTECWVRVYQEGVIDTEIRIEGTGYSDAVLQKIIANRTAQRLIEYAAAIKIREAKGTPTKQMDGGTLNE